MKKIIVLIVLFFIFVPFVSAEAKMRVLIVPGHNDEHWGTQFRNVKEASLTLALGQDLYSLLKKDPNFEPFITRDINGYTDEFSSYFERESLAIDIFRNATREAMIANLENGSLQETSGVPHNDAISDVAFTLYGINKWANENSIDLVIHTHFNDSPDRTEDNPGTYRGFAVYIPEKQYSNAPISRMYGQAIFDQLKTYYSQSILPVEDVGLVEDQDLIAIGPGNSLKAASALIEYGYIYEPQFLDPAIRTLVLKDLAFQTYLGIHKFLGDSALYKGKYGTPLLPFTWTQTVSYGKLFNPEVLRLQAALRYLGMYPVAGREDLDCRMTGNFTPCVQVGLLAFQKKYKIAGGDGTIVGPATRKKLNSLFSK